MPWGQTHTHIPMCEPKRFEETRRVRATGPHLPDLKTASRMLIKKGAAK